jgi:hypothetical protein
VLRFSFLTALVGLLGCGTSQRGPVRRVEAANAGQTGTVRLVDPGTEPRTTLRYAFDESRREELSMTLVVDVAATAEGAATTIQSPPIVFDVFVGPATAEPSGGFRYAVVIDSTDLVLPDGTPSELRRALDDEVAPLGDIEGWVEIDTRGLTRRAAFDVPEAVPLRTETLLGSVRATLLTIPLPEEPVGVGASWEMTREVNNGTFVSEQTATYDLIGLEDGAGDVVVRIRQTADRQRLWNSGLGSGEVQLVGFEANANGQARFALDRIAPVASASSRSSLRATVTEGVETSQVEVAGRVRVDITPR